MLIIIANYKNIHTKLHIMANNSNTNTNKLGQYFTTNNELKEKVYSFILNKPKLILEPSIGQGDLVAHVTDKIKNIKFDIILDDGAHTLESMIKYIELYSKILNDDGILMIEDIPDILWIDSLKNCTPEHLKQYING